MPHISTCLSAVLFLTLMRSEMFAATTSLYLLNGTVVRGEIVDRSVKLIQIKTPSGIVKVKTANLMPVSRQQLKLSADVEPETPSPEIDSVVSQMEKLVAENGMLKKRIAALENQLAKAVTSTPTAAPTPDSRTLTSPADGPVLSTRLKP